MILIKFNVYMYHILIILFFIEAWLWNDFVELEHLNICDWEDDVLLWAVLSNRRELAELFWLRSKDKMCNFMFSFYLKPRQIHPVV